MDRDNWDRQLPLRGRLAPMGYFVSSAYLVRIAFMALFPLLVAEPVMAQDPPVGPVVSGTVSADSDARWSWSGALGYRVSDVLSFGVELTWSRLRDAMNGAGPPYYFSDGSDNPIRELVTFTANVRADLPRVHRVVPFVVGGGGVAADSLAFDLGGSSTQPTRRAVEAGTFLALVGGGGASVWVTRHVSVDGESKWLYMRGHNGQWWRVGLGASYRF